MHIDFESHFVKITKSWDRGGFTYAMPWGGPPESRAGTHVVAIRERTWVFQHPPNLAQVRAFLPRNWALLVSPGFVWGGWLDDGLYHLEVGLLLASEAAAMNFGDSQKQRFAWDVGAGRAVNIEFQPQWAESVEVDLLESPTVVLDEMSVSDLSARDARN